MRQSIAILAGLFLGGAASFTSVAAASDGALSVSDATALAPCAMGTPAKPKTATKPKKAPVEDTIVTVEDPSGGGSTLTISCWCSGGANGNGYAACLGDSCDSANSCCASAYGEGSTASD